MARGSLVTVLLALPLWAGQDAAGFEAEVDAAEAEYVVALEELADWCTSKKLFAERDAVYERVIVYAPDHMEARKVLKHRRERDGSWTVPEKKRAPKNLGKADVLEEGQQRRADVDEAFAERLFGVVGFYEDLGTDGGPTPARKDEVYEQVLGVFPDHAGVRAHRGEAKVGDQWVLEETARAKGRRAELRAIVQDAFAAVPALEELAPTELERSLGISWTAAVGTPRVRVLGTCGRDELERAARAAHATFAVYEAIFDGEVQPLEGYSIYLLCGEADRDAFIGGWPGWGPGRVSEVSLWAGAGVPEDIHLARWDKTAEQRIDGAMRHTLGLCMKLDKDVGLNVAWAWEGFGLYLSRMVVGTRLTWYGSGKNTATASSQTKDLLSRLLNADVNWMNEAYQMLRSGAAPALGSLLDRGIDQMGVRDVLMAYAFAAYLLEGQAERVPAILKAAGQGDLRSREAVSGALGCELEVTRDRLQRWLSERR